MILGSLFGPRFLHQGCDSRRNHRPGAHFANHRTAARYGPIVKLRVRELAFFFLLGAAASLVGDHSHVITRTTEYLTDAVSFVWSSPIWFPILVGAATASLAEIRLHLPSPRTDVTVRQGIAGVAAVIGTYVTTALVHGAPTVPSTTLIIAIAVIIWCAWGDGPSVVCGLLAAVVGPAFEIALAKAGLFAYHDDSDGLFGVGPWLPPLYFAFGVVAAMLGEIAVRRRACVALRGATVQSRR